MPPDTTRARSPPSVTADEAPVSAGTVKTRSSVLIEQLRVLATVPSTEVDDHDAPLRCVFVLVAPPSIILLPSVVFLALAPLLDSLVVHGDVQLGAVLSPPLLFFPASDLFDDPGLEHGTPLLTSCNIPAS
jgi:hypothetical protein